MKEKIKDNIARFFLGMFALVVSILFGTAFAEEPLQILGAVVFALFLGGLLWAAFRAGERNL